jgi:replication initiation and membrane attachment protein DnaB
MDPFMGRYFSIEDARRNVLMQTEEEYKLISKQMKAEIENGAVMDPIDINTVDMMTKQNDALAPEIEADAAEKEREGQAKLAAQNAKLSASDTKKPDSSK